MTIIGINRILRLLEKYKIKGTFWVLGYTVEKYPELFQRIHNDGHEIGNIGYLRQDETINQTKTEIEQANTIIKRITNEKPVGMSLYNYNVNTLKLLPSYGFIYEKSYIGQELPCEILLNEKKTGIISIPINSEMDDYMQVSYSPSYDGTRVNWIWSPIRHYTAPELTLNIWKNEFDACYDEGLFLSTLCHPEISGKASHARVLEKFIQYVKERPKVWIAPTKEVAIWTKSRLKLI
jgi:peptidoglycan/xylan/chitin deacetylase (PgdA/CDA1 family)